VLAASVALSALSACDDTTACEPAPEVTLTLADLRSTDAIVRGTEVTLLLGAAATGACPRLDAVQARAGTRLVAYGGSTCTASTAPRCRDVTFTLPPAGPEGTRTLDLFDGTGRILLEAYPADPSWKLGGGEGRYARGEVIRFASPFPAAMVASADAVIVPSNETDFVPGRVLATRVTEGALEVTVPSDASPGDYRVKLSVYLAPRVVRCEGVASCNFDRPGDLPGTSVLRSLDREVAVRVD
jgi:hypothetical protein